MQITIGIQQSNREIVIDVTEDATAVTTAIENGLSSGLIQLTDKHGRTILVPGKALAYVELGAPQSAPVGFVTP